MRGYYIEVPLTLVSPFSSMWVGSGFNEKSQFERMLGTSHGFHCHNYDETMFCHTPKNLGNFCWASPHSPAVARRMEIRTGYSIDSPNQLLVDWMPHIHSERRRNERNLSLLHSARQILRHDPVCLAVGLPEKFWPFFVERGWQSWLL